MTEEGAHEGETKQFVPSKGLTSAEARELLLQYGRNELEDKKRPKVRNFSLVRPSTVFKIFCVF